jgi:hypothetical protein
MRVTSREYVIVWNWRDDSQDSSYREDRQTAATTAPRALNKFKRELSRKYSNVSDSTIIVHEIYLAD